MRPLEESRVVMLLISIFSAVLLFFYVSYENTQTINSRNPGSSASVSTTEVIENVPIRINLDTDQYYVSGIPESATVELEGSQGILTQFLATNEVVIETPELSELGVGDHEITLNLADSPNRLDVRIRPRRIMISIEEKVTEEHDISLNFDESMVEDGYSIGEAQLSTNRARVTGRQSEMERLDRVQVIIPREDAPYTENINTSYPVAAYDANNEVLDVSVEPAQVNVTIPINVYEKSVPIVLQPVAGDDNVDYDVRIASDQMTEVILRGPRNVLDSISRLPVTVNLEGITSSTTRTIDLSPPQGVNEMSLDTVTVVIDAQSQNQPPEEEESESSDSSEGEEESDADSSLEESESQPSQPNQQ